MSALNVVPNTANYMTLLRVTGAAGHWPVALYLAEEMRFLGWGSVPSLGVLASALDDNALVFHMPAFYKSMVEAGVVSHR